MKWRFVIGLFLFLEAKGQVVETKLQTSPLVVKNKNVKSKESPLQQLKGFELAQDWGTCTRLAPDVYGKEKKIRGWILATWLKCARKSAMEKSDVAPLRKVLDQAAKVTELLHAGPWRSGLFDNWTQAHLAAMNLYTNKKSLYAWTSIETLFSVFDRLDRDARSLVYLAAADMSLGRHKTDAAQNFLQLSLSEKENKAAREKLSSLMLALNQAPAAATVSGVDVIMSDSERKFDERLQGALRANDLLTFVEDGIAYLSEAPNGRRAKWIQEQILLIHQKIFDGAMNGKEPEKMAALREKAVLIMAKAEPTRLAEWASQLHRRGDYAGALALAEKALTALPKSPLAGNLLYVAGRSAHVLGSYQKAQGYFERYAEAFSGGDELSEVLFRLALIHVREERYPSAIAILEKILAYKNGGRYELNSRYWLVRALQAMGNSRSESEAGFIVQKFPFSYYGLRLRAEKAEGFFEWPKEWKQSQSLQGIYYLSSQQKKSLERVEFLSQNGWYWEAQEEISDLPIPPDAKVKILLAQKWVQAQAFPLAIKLVNEAIDQDSSLRQMDYLHLSFPQAFTEKISAEAKNQGLSPYLVRSLIRQESGFSNRAVSSSSALGLMQLLVPTAQQVASELRLSRLSVPEDLFQPGMNIQLGTHYLAKMLRQFDGHVPLALAAYNAGPFRLQTFVQARASFFNSEKKNSSAFRDEIWFDELPWYETSFYVKAILRNSIIYKALDQGRVSLQGILWKDLAEPSSEVEKKSNKTEPVVHL